MRKCRNISQEGKNELWEKLCGKMEEVLEKYKVEETKTGANKGREPQQWGEKLLGLDFSRGSESTAFSETRVCRQDERKKKKEVEQQERVAVMARMMRIMRARKLDLLAADCKKRVVQVAA